MKLLTCLAVLFLLVGCSDPDPFWEHMKPLTNQQIADEISYCNTHNLRVVQWHNSHFQTVFIQCYQPQ